MVCFYYDGKCYFFYFSQFVFVSLIILLLCLLMIVCSIYRLKFLVCLSLICGGMVNFFLVIIIFINIGLLMEKVCCRVLLILDVFFIWIFVMLYVLVMWVKFVLCSLVLLVKQLLVFIFIVIKFSMLLLKMIIFIGSFICIIERKLFINMLKLLLLYMVII